MTHDKQKNKEKNKMIQWRQSINFSGAIKKKNNNGILKNKYVVLENKNEELLLESQ